jgi:hypothetical protein
MQFTSGMEGCCLKLLKEQSWPPENGRIFANVQYSYNAALRSGGRPPTSAILLSRTSRRGIAIDLAESIGALCRRLRQRATIITIGRVREIRDHAGRPINHIGQHSQSGNSAVQPIGIVSHESMTAMRQQPILIVWEIVTDLSLSLGLFAFFVSPPAFGRRNGGHDLGRPRLDSARLVEIGQIATRRPLSPSRAGALSICAVMSEVNRKTGERNGE